jgi:Family of unknown function (DUF6308)
MRLQSGLNIRHPIRELEEMTRRWFAVYDGVVVPQDNVLRPIEIALSVMLNSQISGNTAALIWEHRDEVERYLTNISAQIDLIDVPADSEIPGIGSIASAFESLCALRRVKFGIAAKILHKKRPALIPIIDSRVYGYYHAHVIHRWQRGLSWGQQIAILIVQFHRDMLSVESELRDLSNRVRARGTPLSHVRILDYFLWSAGRERAVL